MKNFIDQSIDEIMNPTHPQMRDSCNPASKKGKFDKKVDKSNAFRNVDRLFDPRFDDLDQKRNRLREANTDDSFTNVSTRQLDETHLSRQALDAQRRQSDLEVIARIRRHLEPLELGGQTLQALSERR